MTFLTKAVFICLCVGMVASASAQSTEPLQLFTSYADIRTPAGIPAVTAVWEVDLTGYLEDTTGLAVYDMTSEGFVPSRVVHTERTAQTKSTVIAPERAANLVDGKIDTVYEFSFDDTGASTESTVIIRTASPIEADTITIALDGYVALPHTVLLRTQSAGGAQKTVVAPRRLDSSRVTFPRTTASEWVLTLSHTQPLRIAEVVLHERNPEVASRVAVRFLADPAHVYRVYAEPERSPRIGKYLTEMPDLVNDDDLIQSSVDAFRTNDTYIPSDIDADTIPDMSDNCVEISNTDQLDIDMNKRGDACDDFDRDRVVNDRDNCPSTPNANQRDTDEDTVGDVCDAEESRFTEKHAWIPWAGIGFAALVMVVLGVFALRMKPEEPQA